MADKSADDTAGEDASVSKDLCSHNPGRRKCLQKKILPGRLANETIRFYVEGDMVRTRYRVERRQHGLNRRLPVAIALTASGLLSWLAVPPSKAAARPPVPEVRQTSPIVEDLIQGQGEREPESSAALRDFAQFAAQKGESLDAVKEKYRSLEKFSVVATELEEWYPDTFVRAGVSRLGERGHYYTLFTEDPPAKAAAVLSELDVDTALRSGLPASAQELARVAEAISSSLVNDPKNFTFVGTGLSRDALAMTIEFSVPEDPLKRPSPFELERLQVEALRAGAAASADGKLPVPVTYLALPPGERAVSEATVQGGRRLFFASGGTVACTGGFTARDEGNNAPGLVTAQHCNDNLRYENDSGVISTSPRIASDTGGGNNIDLQWHRTLSGNSTNGEFRATGTSASDDRTVSARANPPDGGLACHWGSTTGYSCATVTDVDQCRNTGSLPGMTCGFVYLDDDISEGGDSGGPYFLGNTAYGIHSGEMNDADSSYFTAIGRVAANLDVQVIVTP